MGAALEVSFAPLYAVAAMSAATAAFGWVQNRGWLIGGRISLAKILYLNFTLVVFFILPFCYMRNAALDPGLRSAFGWLFLSFAARVPIEFYLIYVTISWRCAYGIGHDWATLALAVLLRLGLGPLEAPADQRALLFLNLYQAALLIESWMAWSFSKLASPKDGIYFANEEEEKFRRVNRASWAAVAAGYSALAVLLWASRYDFR